MSPPLISKETARYTGAGGKEHCSLCRHFSPRRGGMCARVLGAVSPRGWCRLFSREMRALIADASSFNGGAGGPALALDFLTPGTLDPLITFTRASTATYFDSAGVMQTAATNAPRWDYDPATLALRGLLLEDQRTNGIRNSTMVGAVPGSPGTLPTGWGFGGSPAVVGQMVATGTENGIPYIDIRLSGTTTSGQVQLAMDNGAGLIAAANAQAWTASGYVRLIAGSLSNITTVQWMITEATTAGGAIRHNFGPAITPTSAALASQRSSALATLSGGGTVGGVVQRFGVVVPGGVAIDATFRIGAPQLELGGFATSYIPTTAAAVTRSIDSCTIQPASMGWFTAPGGSWFAEFIMFNPAPSISTRVIGRIGATSATPLFLNSSRMIGQSDSASMVTANALTANVVNKAASTWATGRATACSNGGAVASSAALVTGYGVLSGSGIYLLMNTTVPADSMMGYMRAVRYWPAALSDAQLQAMTA